MSGADPVRRSLGVGGGTKVMPEDSARECSLRCMLSKPSVELSTRPRVCVNIRMNTLPHQGCPVCSNIRFWRRSQKPNSLGTAPWLLTTICIELHKGPEKGPREPMSGVDPVRRSLGVGGGTKAMPEDSARECPLRCACFQNLLLKCQQPLVLCGWFYPDVFNDDIVTIL